MSGFGSMPHGAGAFGSESIEDEDAPTAAVEFVVHVLKPSEVKHFVFAESPDE